MRSGGVEKNVTLEWKKAIYPLRQHLLIHKLQLSEFLARGAGPTLGRRSTAFCFASLAVKAKASIAKQTFVRLCITESAGFADIQVGLGLQQATRSSHLALHVGLELDVIAILTQAVC